MNKTDNLVKQPKPIKATKTDCLTTQKYVTLHITHNAVGTAADLREAIGSAWVNYQWGLAPLILKIISAMLPGEATGAYATVSYGCGSKAAANLGAPPIPREEASQIRQDFRSFSDNAKNLRVIVIDENTGKEIMNTKVIGKDCTSLIS